MRPTTLLAAVLASLASLAACGGNDHDARPAANPCIAALSAFTTAASHLECTADTDCAPAPGMTMAGAMHGCPGAVRSDSVSAMESAARDVASNGCAAITPSSPLECNGQPGTVHCIRSRCQATY